MKALKRILISIVALTVFNYTAMADQYSNDSNISPTVIHLDGYKNYFVFKENIQELKPGTYHLVVSNKANSNMNLEIQDIASAEFLDVFTVAPGETHISFIRIGQKGAHVRDPKLSNSWQALKHYLNKPEI